MANHVYKETKVPTKKLAGIYNADTHTICVDGVDMDIIKELEDFEGAPLEFTVRVKEEIDLLDEAE